MSKNKIKENIRLTRHPELDRKEVYYHYVLIHIIPVCLSGDESESNLEIMNRADAARKKRLDAFIFNKLESMGLIEYGDQGQKRIAGPSLEKIREEYINLLREYSNQFNLILNDYIKLTKLTV